MNYKRLNTTGLCVQFSQYLHENAAYVRPLEEVMLQLHQSITEDTVTVLVSVQVDTWCG